jgi:hypothetical protein
MRVQIFSTSIQIKSGTDVSFNTVYLTSATCRAIGNHHSDVR